MSGHSKWSSIKHKKANTDAKRGQLFTKICKEITIAARGGGDPAINSSLRLVIQRARDANVPNKNIDRAIERATGGGDADQLEEMSYEGYGPGGTAVLIDVVTDNKNRTVADLRLAFSRGGGSLAENGTVAWQFELRGVANVAATDIESGMSLRGYEMHMGETEGPDRARPMFTLAGRSDGATSQDGRVRGCYLHGLFADDGYRAAFLGRLKARRTSGVAYDRGVDAALDGIAAALEDCLDLDRLLEIAHGQ